MSRRRVIVPLYHSEVCHILNTSEHWDGSPVLLSTVYAHMPPFARDKAYSSQIVHNSGKSADYIQCIGSSIILHKVQKFEVSPGSVCGYEQFVNG